MLRTVNLSKHFPNRELFKNVNLDFQADNCYGIIGANGVGKSTFLKIISKKMEASSGNVQLVKNKRIGFLEQDHFQYNDKEVVETVIMGHKELYEIQQRKDALYNKEDFSEEDGLLAATLEGEFADKGGYEAEADAEKLLNSLQIPQEIFYKLMKDIKHEHKVKILLAQALFGSPDVLILDEPTNHLDLEAITWLEDFLINYKNCVILVSHDTAFLDKVCTRIVDIDYQTASLFHGNYSFWKESSELALELQKKSNLKLEQKRARLQQFVDRFSANASKSTQATSRKKSLEKLEIDEIKPSSRKYPYIGFDYSRDPGKDILTIKDLSYINEIGEVLFENLSFSVSEGDKIAILGKDDITRSKLLEIISNGTGQTSGEIKWGVTITSNYFPYNNDDYFLSSSQSNKEIIDWLKPYSPDEAESFLRSFLGRMLFSGDDVFKKVSACSGGEKVRLLFSKMMLKPCNFLILDQPLNHLDTESIDSVVKAVERFKHNLILCTYNTALMEKCNVFIELDKNQVFKGTIDEYLATKKK